MSALRFVFQGKEELAPFNHFIGNTCFIESQPSKVQTTFHVMFGRILNKLGVSVVLILCNNSGFAKPCCLMLVCV